MRLMTDTATTAAPAAPRRGRPPKAEGQLSRDAITTAALAVIDDDGVASVSMRSVSRRLGVDAKSLYHYVNGKDDLLDAVAEHLLGQLNMPAPSDSVSADLKALAGEFRRVTLSHPEAATLVLTRQLSSLAGLGPVDAVLTVLRRAGATSEQAVQLMRILLATLIGTLLREVSAGLTFGTGDTDAIAKRRADLQAAGLSEVAAAADHLSRFDRDAEFNAAVNLTVDFVVAQLKTGGHPLRLPE